MSTVHMTFKSQRITLDLKINDPNLGGTSILELEIFFTFRFYIVSEDYSPMHRFIVLLVVESRENWKEHLLYRHSTFRLLNSVHLNRVCVLEDLSRVGFSLSSSPYCLLYLIVKSNAHYRYQYPANWNSMLHSLQWACHRWLFLPLSSKNSGSISKVYASQLYLMFEA